MDSTAPTGYECFDKLIRQLRASGDPVVADKLDSMLHGLGWTTSSGLIGELGLEILAFQRNTAEVPVELDRALSKCMLAVQTVWPEIK
jgi:hypothetical protein